MKEEANLTKPKGVTVSHCLFADTAVSLFILQMSVWGKNKALKLFSKLGYH